MRTAQEETEKHQYTNRLINESSPYLLQHSHNPVDWFPWSDEALEKARNEDKPIFLSIGYAACHWCHIMEKESFENEQVAEILNENFVSIKVDREQRPDLDQIYMTATTAMTGSGGWPMSVFLTPDLKPFFSGTYFPPEDRFGRPGFRRLITEISRAYRNERGKIEEYSTSFVNALLSTESNRGRPAELDTSIIERGVRGLLKNYDRTNGGFGGAPKFPHPTELSFLLQIYAARKDENILNAVEHSLTAMARGGIYDQLGGGFHRYATDPLWLVPHFEKMLYDNALLAVTYSEAYQIIGNKLYRKTVKETLDYMIREMGHDNGGFYSSLDADSEGEEGKFYVWTRAEIDSILKEKSERFCEYYNITEDGNFEDNTNILNITNYSERLKKRSDEGPEKFESSLSMLREKLLAERSGRARPFTDDKILTSWNALAVSAFSKGFQITRDERYRQAAQNTAIFIRNGLFKSGKLFHSFHRGAVSPGPFLEDYAYLAKALIDLYEIAHDYRWIEFASQLASEAVELFSDKDGSLYLSPDNQADHFMRPRDVTDGALPAPGSILIQSLLRLAEITADDIFQKQAEKALAAISQAMNENPYVMAAALSALDYLLSDKIELVVVGEKEKEGFLKEIHNRYLPNRIIVVSDKGDEGIALLEGRQSDGRTVAYVCKNFACLLPATSPEELKKQLENL